MKLFQRRCRTKATWQPQSWGILKMNRQQETNQESGAKVFVPQVPSRYDSYIGRWVPTVNLDPAKAFG